MWLQPVEKFKVQMVPRFVVCILYLLANHGKLQKVFVTTVTTRLVWPDE